MQRELVERELTEVGPGQAVPRKGRRSVTVNLAESPLSWLHARGHVSERQLAARQRFDSAIAAAGPGLSDILWRVVCNGDALPVAEKALAWPVRSGKLVLRLALDRVAGFYRIR